MANRPRLIVSHFLPMLAGLMDEDERRREMARQDFEALRADASERLRFQLEIAKGVLQALLVVNGGAIVALFTLVGAQGDQLVIGPGALKGAFGWFVGGLVSVLSASFAGFLSQMFFQFASEKQSWQSQSLMLDGPARSDNFELDMKRGNSALFVGLGLAVLSMLCFAAGSWSALSGAMKAAALVVAPS